MLTFIFEIISTIILKLPQFSHLKIVKITIQETRNSYNLTYNFANQLIISRFLENLLKRGNKGLAFVDQSDWCFLIKKKKVKAHAGYTGYKFTNNVETSFTRAVIYSSFFWNPLAKKFLLFKRKVEDFLAGREHKQNYFLEERPYISWMKWVTYCNIKYTDSRLISLAFDATIIYLQSLCRLLPLK